MQGRTNIPESKSIGGHLVLDLLNTVSMIDGKLVDAIEDEESLKRWLIDFGVWEESKAIDLKQGVLLNAIKELREIVRNLVMARKDHKTLEVKGINHYLSQDLSHLELTLDKDGRPALKRTSNKQTAEQLLSPIAEATAELITNQDFDLIRRCENSECVLWFFDRTKGHRRRWCSMASCGNRHKVNTFRQRQKDK